MEFKTIKERNDWVLRNRGLADSHVNTYLKYDPNLKSIEEDLRQAGLMGLMIGISKFDESRGNAKLSTIASSWARAEIQKCIAHNKGSFHIPYGKLKELPEKTEMDETYITLDEDFTDEKIAIEEMMSVLTPLERKALRYSYGMDSEIEDIFKPLVNTLSFTAKRKIKTNYSTI